MSSSQAPPAHLFFTPSILERLPLGAMFPTVQPVEVELGSGDGSFLAEYARQQPEKNFIGVERLLGRARKLSRKGLRAGLSNLRVIRIEAAYLLEHLLPPGSIAALHIYFPDPWPKRKHLKNRLINESFPALARTALTAGGVVHLRTDDADYFSQMTRVFAAAPEFVPVEAPQTLREILTDFEKTFHQRGLATRSVSYRRL